MWPKLFLGYFYAVLVTEAAAAETGTLEDTKKNTHENEHALSEVQTLIPSTWTSFQWDRFGVSLAYPMHKVCTQHPILLRVVDVNCPGDRFQILINEGAKGFSSQVAAPPPKTPSSESKGTRSGGGGGPQEWPACVAYSQDPSVAYDSGTWSRYETRLPSGCYTIQARVVDNPFGHGKGYLRFDYLN